MQNIYSFGTWYFFKLYEVWTKQKVFETVASQNVLTREEENVRYTYVEDQRKYCEVKYATRTTYANLNRSSVQHKWFPHSAFEVTFVLLIFLLLFRFSFSLQFYTKNPIVLLKTYFNRLAVHRAPFYAENHENWMCVSPRAVCITIEHRSKINKEKTHMVGRAAECNERRKMQFALGHSSWNEKVVARTECT